MSKASRDKKKKSPQQSVKEKTQNESFNIRKEALGPNTER